MSELNVTLPGTMKLRGPIGNIPRDVSTATWTSAFVAYLIEYAWDVRMQRCTASADTEAKKSEARAKMFESMCRGEVPEGGGGGGPRLSPEQRGWLKWVNGASGYKSGDKKPVNGQTLARAQDYLCRQALLKGGVKPAEIEVKVKTNLQPWIAFMEQNEPALKLALEAERALDAPVKMAEGFSVV